MLAESTLIILVPIYKDNGDILIFSCYRAIMFLRHSMMVGKIVLIIGLQKIVIARDSSQCFKTSIIPNETL